MAVEAVGFHWLDGLLFGLVLALSLAIGIYSAFSGGRQKTNSEYLMGDRQLGVFPVSMSIYMSYVSAIVVLGNTSEMYLYGIQWWLFSVGAISAYFFVARVFIPLFYNLKMTSTFEYLEARFKTKATRLSGDIMLIISQVFYMGIATFAPATSMNAMTGFPVWASIVISIVLATVYTAIGGMKAVVWTDSIQGVIYLIGVIVVLSVGIVEVGGIVPVWEVSKATGRLNIFDFNGNPFDARLTFWSLTIGTFIGISSSIGTNQTSVQRYCSLPSETKAKLAVILQTPAELIVKTLTCLLGLVVFTYYHQKGCDPYRGGIIDDSNQLLPWFIMEVVNFPGVPGLFMAVLFCGALSSLSSSLSALAAVTWTDFFSSHFSHIPENRQAFISKVIVAGYGCLAMAMAFAVQYLGVHVQQAANSLVTATTGPLFGMFLLGFFFPWVNGIATVIGSLTGLCFMLWVVIGSYITFPYREFLPTNIDNCTFTGNATAMPMPQDPPDVFPLYKLSFMWYDAFGGGVTIIVGLLVTFCTGFVDPNTLSPNLVVPIFDRLCCCLPFSVLHKLWCGIRHDHVMKEDDDVTQVLPPDKEPLLGSGKPKSYCTSDHWNLDGSTHEKHNERQSAAETFT